MYVMEAVKKITPWRPLRLCTHEFRGKIKIEKLIERTPWPDQILQRIAVKHSQESVRRFLQRPAEHASRLNAAIVALLKTSDDFEFLLRIADYRADVDLIGFPQKPEAAVLALYRLDLTELAKLVHDLHQMAFRNIEPLRNLGNRGEFIHLQSRVHQHAQRIISMESKSHHKPQDRLSQNIKTYFLLEGLTRSRHYWPIRSKI